MAFVEPRELLQQRMEEKLSPTLEKNGGLLKSLSSEVFSASPEDLQILLQNFKDQIPAGYLSIPSEEYTFTRPQGLLQRPSFVATFAFAMISNSMKDTSSRASRVGDCQKAFRNAMSDQYLAKPWPGTWKFDPIEILRGDPFRTAETFGFIYTMRVNCRCPSAEVSE